MMNDQEISSDKLSSQVNALIIIDIQEKIIRPELSPIAEFRKFEKMEFSLAKSEDFLKQLKDKKITNLIVCGIETHICIQQTVLDLSLIHI